MIPEGYFPLPAGWVVMRGDFWLRPYDGCWVETGKAHWHQTIMREGEYARRNIPQTGRCRADEDARAYEAFCEGTSRGLPAREML